MLFTKTNPVGIDVSLQMLQQYLHNSLLTKWGLPANSPLYECYGRCYRNRKDNGYIAEHFKGGKDYSEVYWNDSLHAISFFGIDERFENESGTIIQDVHAVFFFDLLKLKPSITHRADEEVRKDVYNTLATAGYGFEVISVETGIENVLREYPGYYRSERLNFIDMHPVHCFRVNMKLNYDINNC